MESLLKHLKSRIRHAENTVRMIKNDHGDSPNSTHTYYGGHRLGYYEGLLAAHENALDKIEEYEENLGEKVALQEVIDFFEYGDTHDKNEVISEILEKLSDLKHISSDEIGLYWGREDYVMGLDDFTEQFYDKTIEVVCNVLKSFQK